jgi:outer membrane protein TolC
METLNNNRKQFDVNAHNLALAEKVFASRRALFTEGVTTLMELLDSESDLTEARNLYKQSMIDVQTGLLDVYKAKGTLLTDFLQSL